MEIKELTREKLADQSVIRKNSKRGEEVIKIEISKVVVRDGFNVRQDYGDIESLANSILENGQINAARVDALVDGTFVLTDGHRRFKALQLLAEQGHEPLLKAIVNPIRTTEEQRIIQMFTTQDNKQLSPLEVAELIKRLVNMGYEVSDVAKKIGKSVTYVSNMLSVSEESPEVKKIIEAGQMNVSTLLEVKRNVASQSERTEKIKSAASKGEKVTAESITGKKAKKYDEAASKLIAHFSLEDSEETKSAIINILKESF